MATIGYAQIGGPYTDTTWQTWTATASTAATTVWTRWAGESTSASVTEGIWQTWATNTTTTASHEVQTAWSKWAQVSENETTPSVQPTVTVRAPGFLAEERARLDARQLEWSKQEKARQDKQAAAKAKAELLLIAHLNEEQARAWQEERAFFVTSQSGKRYRIKEGYAHNIHAVDADDKPIRELCVHIDQGCPLADNVLAQKLALQYNEEALLKKANIWDVRNDRALVHRSDS